MQKLFKINLKKYPQIRRFLCVLIWADFMPPFMHRESAKILFFFNQRICGKKACHLSGNFIVNLCPYERKRNKRSKIAFK